MNEQEKANGLIKDFGATLANKVCNEVLDVIDRCDPMDDSEIESEIDIYKEYWNTIKSLIK